MKTQTYRDMDNSKCQIIDFSDLYNTRMNPWEIGKIDKYQDLVMGMKKVWIMNRVLIPVLNDTLGTPQRKQKNLLVRTEIETNIVELHVTAII